LRLVNADALGGGAGGTLVKYFADATLIGKVGFGGETAATDGGNANFDVSQIIDGSFTEPVFRIQRGNVGIGTPTPNEQLEITKNFRLPASAAAMGTATAGVIFSDGNRYIHNFGTNNFFAGVNAGNFTMTGLGRNTAVGVDALKKNTQGIENTASGNLALFNNTTGSNNTASGARALQNNTGTGIDNTAVGAFALQLNNTGRFNTAVGSKSLKANTSGFLNTAVGENALVLSEGDNNTAVGSSALDSNTTGSSNTALGVSADVSANNLTNATAIGANAVVDASNKVRIGNALVTVIEGQVDWSFISDSTKKENFLQTDGESPNSGIVRES